MNQALTEYLLPAETKAEAFLIELGNRISLSPPTVHQEKRFFLDTFDRRIHRRGGSLWWRWEDSGIRLFWRTSPGLTPSSWRLDRRVSFASALPMGDLRSALEPVIAMRRLLPLVEIRLRTTAFRMLDRRQKTVAYLRWTQSKAILPKEAAGKENQLRSLPCRLITEPVRGYAKKYQQLTGLLNAAGLLQTEVTQLETALEVVGSSGGAGFSKSHLELSSAQPAEAALRQIFLHLLNIIEANEAGTRSDLDSEFLHDLRVAVRRTRAALTQVRDVFPSPLVAHFRQEFSWLGKITGPTRDLDVYLLKLPTYETHLPSSVTVDLAPLRQHLLGRQEREQKRLARALGSQRYRRLKQEWRRELESPTLSQEPPPNANRPISELARKRIWKAYRKVFTRGSAIHRSTPAEALHDLRIDCKKLRYLLEFFRSLFEPKSIASLIRALKGLQDTLGDFNDFEVQRDQLAKYAEEMTSAGSAPPYTLLAMGRLLGLLEEWQQLERKRFHPQFEAFSASYSIAQRLFRMGTGVNLGS